MSKLNAPLFSFGASGKLANALVYFGWKGLDVVRSYVVPANPKSAKQLTQRGYLTTVVARIHADEKDVGQPMTAADRSAYALLGSLKPTPRTWFNTMCKNAIDQMVAGDGWTNWVWGATTPASGQVTLRLSYNWASGDPIASGKIYYGISKTNLSSSIAATVAEITAGKVVSGLTNGTKYYFQFRPLLPAAYVNCNSGIYSDIPTA